MRRKFLTKKVLFLVENPTATVEHCTIWENWKIFASERKYEQLVRTIIELSIENLRKYEFHKIQTPIIFRNNHFSRKCSQNNYYFLPGIDDQGRNKGKVRRLRRRAQGHRSGANCNPKMKIYFQFAVWIFSNIENTRKSVTTQSKKRRL